jgi:hypothetical protein
MERRFSYKGQDYRVDDEGNVYEDKVFGSKVGKMDKDGNFTIKTGIFTEETGRISSWTGDVYETGIFGADKGKVGEEKGTCFLTTACVEYAGLHDNCWELQMMRRLRDDYIKNLPDGNAFLAEYYATAPAIVTAIKSQSDHQSVFGALLDRVRAVARMIEQGRWEEALGECRAEFERLKLRYLGAQSSEHPLHR